MKWNVLAVAALLLVVPGMVYGAAVISATVGGASTVTVLPGNTCAVDIGLSGVAVGVAAFDGMLADLGNTGKLSIAGATAAAARTWGATFNPANGDFATATDVRGVLNPKSKPLGAMAMSVASYGPELYPSTLETLQLKVDASTVVGTIFTVNLQGLILSDELANGIEVGAGQNLIIKTPEPISMLLLGLGGLFLRRRHA